MIYVRDDLVPLFPEGRVAQYFAIRGEVCRRVKGRWTAHFERGGRRFYIKCHEGVGWLEILKNLLSLRLPVLGARNEWRAIGRLEALGLATMRVVAFGEEGWSPASRRSFLVTEALRATHDLEHWAGALRQAPEAGRAKAKRGMICNLARITRTLHGNGINHRDYYLCHLRVAAAIEAVARDTATLRVYIMDLHRTQIRRRTPTRWVAKDLAGLLYSSHYGPARLPLTSGDLIRFLKVYRSGDWRQSLSRDRALWRKVGKRLCRDYRREFGREPLLPRLLRGRTP